MSKMNNLSNRSHAWLMATLLSAIVIVTLIMEYNQQIGNALAYLRWALIALALLSILYGLYRIWHAERLRSLDRKSKAREIARADQTQRHQQEMERARIQLETLRAQNDHERLMLEARWRAQHVIVPEGHTAVFPDREMLTIQSPRRTVQLVRDQDKKAQDDQEVRLPEPVDVYTLLLSGAWQPNEHSLLLAINADGPVSVAYDLAWHIALAGSTGGGKTNMLRLILAQMVLFHKVFYISPAFAPIKANHEDWRQIQARLAGPVARTGGEIGARLIWACNELKRRQDAEFNGDYSWEDESIYIVIDEYREVIARYPDAPNLVSTLLRQARQYKIFVVIAAQDFLIKNIGGDSGARDCFRTALYFGGDPNTCRALLDIQGTLPYEEDLGKSGHLVVRTKSTKTSQARAPFMSNRAIYSMLGWPDDPILDDAPVTAIPNTPTAFEMPSAGLSNARNSAETTSGIRYTRPLYEPSSEPLNASEMGVSTVIDEVSTMVVDGPSLRPGDLRFSEEQEQEFIRRMRKNPDLAIKTCLRQMNDGAGLSNNYHRHASWLVTTYGLKQRGDN